MNENDQNAVRPLTDEEKAALEAGQNPAKIDEVNSTDVVSQERSPEAFTKPEGDQDSNSRSKTDAELNNEFEKPQDAAPVPAYSGSAPHQVDENPEEHIGEETSDPWADDSQTDWDNNEPFVDPTPTRVDNPAYNSDQETSN